MVGGLIQLVAYGQQDVYLSGDPQITFFKTVYRRYANFATDMYGIETFRFNKFERKFNNFEIIIDDTVVGKETYYSNELLHIKTINLGNLDDNIIFINSEKLIKGDIEKLKIIVKKEKGKENEERRHRNVGFQIFKPNYRSVDSATRAKNKSQNRQIKSQTKNFIRRR